MASTERITPPATETLWPFPDYRDLYLLVAGIVVGVVLSPAVMGQFVPGWQSKLFGGAAIEQQLEQARQQWQQDLQTLEESGVSQAAVQQKRQQHEARRQALGARLTLSRDQRAGRLAVAIMLTLGLVMVIEAFLAPQPDQNSTRATVPMTLGRLKSVRYALLAMFIALLLARPSMLASATFIFTALLAAVALLVGLVPLGRRQGASDEEE